MMFPFFLLLVSLIMRTNDAFQNKVDKLSHVKKRAENTRIVFSALIRMPQETSGLLRTVSRCAAAVRPNYNTDKTGIMLLPLRSGRGCCCLCLPEGRR